MEAIRTIRRGNSRATPEIVADGRSRSTEESDRSTMRRFCAEMTPSLSTNLPLSPAEAYSYEARVLRIPSVTSYRTSSRRYSQKVRAWNPRSSNSPEEAGGLAPRLPFQRRYSSRFVDASNE